jgi:hypothetical protein
MNFESLQKPLLQVRNRFWLLVPHQEQEVVKAKRRSRRPWEQPLIGAKALWTIHPTAAGHVILFPFSHDVVCGCLGERRTQPLPVYLVMRIDDVLFYLQLGSPRGAVGCRFSLRPVLHLSFLLRVVTSQTPSPLLPHLLTAAQDAFAIDQWFYQIQFRSTQQIRAPRGVRFQITQQIQIRLYCPQSPLETAKRPGTSGPSPVLPSR